jgi:hypothetical protein
MKKYCWWYQSALYGIERQVHHNSVILGRKGLEYKEVAIEHIDHSSLIISTYV